MQSEDKSSGVESEVAVQPLCPSADNAPVSDKALCISGSKYKRYPDEYIQQQIRDGWPDIDPQQRSWADEFVGNGYNHREAATEVGLKAERGAKLRKDPLLLLYIAEIERQVNIHPAISKQFLMAHHMQLLDAAMGNIDMPRVTGSGESFIAKKFEGDLATKQLERMAVLSGITKEDEGKGNVIVNIDVGALLGHGNTDTPVIEGEVVEKWSSDG